MVDKPTWVCTAIALIVGIVGEPAAASSKDQTADALTVCLDKLLNASTAGQTQCQGTAMRSYDHRMNAAYTTLLRILPPMAGEQLRQSQRAWLAFRDRERVTRDAIFATRQGTMYVPMQASAETEVTRVRALQLENYRNVMSIEQ
jgi:uncharacterized protein YecT (DUF1311 family)